MTFVVWLFGSTVPTKVAELYLRLVGFGSTVTTGAKPGAIGVSKERTFDWTVAVELIAITL